MKPITKNQNAIQQAEKTAAAPREAGTPPAPKTAQAQCCAKVSRATMGCHD